jgi:AcrR family transcriptional regulator
MPTKAKETAGSTRERILDTALELFTTKGYDGTSLRDIAERLGVTKAALYYHFERKEDILLELHLRLHTLSLDALASLEGLPGPEVARRWPELLDQFIDVVVDNRQLFQMHERNRNALEQIAHNERHAAEQEDMEQVLQRTLSHPDVAPEQRMRMVASLGAVAGGLLGGAKVFEDLTLEARADLVRNVVRDLVAPLASG